MCFWKKHDMLSEAIERNKLRKGYADAASNISSEGANTALPRWIEEDQGTIATDAAAVANDAMPGIIIASPPIAVPCRTKPLEELAEPAALGRGFDIRGVDGVEQL